LIRWQSEKRHRRTFEDLLLLAVKREALERDGDVFIVPTLRRIFRRENLDQRAALGRGRRARCEELGEEIEVREVLAGRGLGERDGERAGARIVFCFRLIVLDERAGEVEAQEVGRDVYGQERAVDGDLGLGRLSYARGRESGSTCALFCARTRTEGQWMSTTTVASVCEQAKRGVSMVAERKWANRRPPIA
jgi:hypothetical protein